MKQEVLQFLKSLPDSDSEKFNKAFELLRKSNGTNFNQIRVYNMQGATAQNIKNILYDLQKLHGITDAEVLSKKGVKVSPIEKVVEQIKTVVTENSVDTGILTEASDSKTNLHQEFPFLSDKECPAELHIVTGQLVASWKRYNALHAELQLVSSGEKELSEDALVKLTADTNEAFELNDKLYKELEHYRDNNVILGEVDALKEYAIKKEIDAMSTEELVKYKSNSVPYLSKANKDLQDEKVSAEKKEIIRERIADREMRLSLVNKKLGMNG